MEKEEVRETAAEEYPELGVEIIVCIPGDDTGRGTPPE
jgi:6-phosphofructokinase